MTHTREVLRRQLRPVFLLLWLGLIGLSMCAEPSFIGVQEVDRHAP